MASILLLLRRIKTAQNVSKTTRAMQMIAASKLKKAQDAALTARPYVEKLSYVTKNLADKIEKPAMPEYMKQRTGNGKTLIIAISPDKGLCGGLVTNLAREVLKRNTKDDMYVTIGKKMENVIAHSGNELVASFVFGNTLPSYDIVFPVIDLIDQYYLTKKVDNVMILSTHFVNVFTQQAVLTPLLPIKLPENVEVEKKDRNKFQLFEPDLESILPALLRRYMEMSLYQEILESYLAEQSARMLAMQNATNNAKEIIEDLRLEYNKTRQAKITSEILDITGAQATQ